MTTTLADYQHSPRIRRILAGLAPISCPPEIEELSLVDNVIDHVELTMRALPEVIRLGLVAGMTGYDLASMVWPGNGARPSTALARERAHRYYLSWKTSPVALQREFIKGIEGLLCMAYYEMPEVKEMIDYTPERWIAKVKRVRLQTYSDEIRRHEDSILAPDPLPSLSEIAALVEARGAASATKKEAG